MPTPMPAHPDEKCFICGGKGAVLVTYEAGMRGVVCQKCADEYKLIDYFKQDRTKHEGEDDVQLELL